MLNSQTFGNPIKEVEPLEVQEELKNNEIENNETEEESVPVKSSIIIYQLEDETLGINTVGDVALSEVTLFTEYLNRYKEDFWNKVASRKED